MTRYRFQLTGQVDTTIPAGEISRTLWEGLQKGVGDILTVTASEVKELREPTMLWAEPEESK